MSITPTFTCIDLTEQFTANVAAMISTMFHLQRANPASAIRTAEYYCRRAIGHADTFLPINPTPGVDAASMLDTLAGLDWQGAAGFWQAMAGAARGQQGRQPVLDAIIRFTLAIDRQHPAQH